MLGMPTGRVELPAFVNVETSVYVRSGIGMNVQVPSFFGGSLKVRTGALIFGSLAVLGVVVGHWYRPGYVVASVDIAPQEQYWYQLRSAFSAWNYSASPFGSMSTGVGVVTYLAVGALLQKIAGFSLAQMGIFWLFLSFSWLGAYRLARGLNCSLGASVVAAWCYTFNPYQQLQIPVVTFEWMLSAIPWLFYLLLDANRNPENRPRVSARFGLMALFVLSVLSITPQLLFEVTVDLVIFQICIHTLTAERRNFWSRFVPFSALFVLALSLWWIVPLVASISDSSIAHPLGLGDNSWIYRRSSFLENLRFLSSWAWVPEYGYFPFAGWYDSNPITYASGFTLFGAACASIVVGSGSRTIVFRNFFFAALVMIFIAKGLHGPFAELNLLFFNLPLAFLYQEPAGAIAFAVVAFSVCTAFFVDSVREVFAIATLRVRIRPLVSCLLVGSSFVSCLPMLTGEIFHGANLSLPSMYVRVPDYWAEARSYMDSLDGGTEGIAAVFPPDVTYQAAYSFGYFGVDALPALSLQRPIMQIGSAGSYFGDNVGRELAARARRLVDARSKETPTFLRDIGVRFVVDRNDVVLETEPMTDEVSLARTLGRIGKKIGPLTIFDLGKVPRFELYRGFAAAELGGWSPADIEELGALYREPVVLSGLSLPDSLEAGALVVEASGEAGAATVARLSSRFERRGLDRGLWDDADRVSLPISAMSKPAIVSSDARNDTAAIDVAVPAQRGVLPRADDAPTVYFGPISRPDTLGDTSIDYRRSTYVFDIINPVPKIVEGTLAVAIRPSEATTLTVRSDYGRAAASFKPNRALAWGAISGFRLGPGLNHISLATGSAPIDAKFEMTRPAYGFREFALAFRAARVRPNASTSLDNYFENIGLVRIGRRARPNFQIALDVRSLLQNAGNGVVYELSDSVSTTACYLPIGSGMFSSEEVVTECARTLGIAPTSRSSDDTTIRSVSVVVQHYRRRIDPLLLSADLSGPREAFRKSMAFNASLKVSRSVSTSRKQPTMYLGSSDVGGSFAIRGLGAAGRPPVLISDSACRPLSFFDMLYCRIPNGISGEVLTNIRYSPFWGAIVVAGLPKPIHTEANGWRNAWLVEGGGSFILLNEITIVCVFLQVLALGLACFLILRSQRRNWSARS